MNTDAFITNYNTRPSKETLDSITLDAAKYVDADARYVSRLLKAAGLKRAEHTGRGFYSFGFNISGNSLSIYGSAWRHSTGPDPREVELMDACVKVLREKGFVVTGSGTMGRHVFKRDDDAAISNLHYVYVAVGGELVSGYSVPAFQAEQDRVRKAHAAQKAAERKAADAKVARRDNLLAELRSAGLTVHSAGSFQITVYADELWAYLGKPVAS